LYDLNASAERMRIDSSGNLLVGHTTVDSFTNVGHQLDADGYAIHTRTSAPALYVGRKTTDGSIMEFNKDGTTVGSIGVQYTNDLFIGSPYSNQVGLRFSGGSKLILPAYGNGTVTNADGTIDLGSGSLRFKDLYLSGGVYLGGTGSANKLDDYEEGTFTPTLEFGGASVGVSYTARFGRYVKVGKLVYVNIAINLNSKGTSTGSAKLSGLPFTQDASGTNFPNLSLRSVSGITFTNCLYATADDGATTVSLLDDNGSGTQASLTNADFLNSTEFNVTGVYEAA